MVVPHPTLVAEVVAEAVAVAETVVEAAAEVQGDHAQLAARADQS